tara:strand:- start:234 stop:1370 length:1137 start_codon:yes stop_codon:yes gene_type:complete
MKYCTKCVFPSVAATPLTFDENGVCSGCRASNIKQIIDWAERKEMFRELCDEYKTDSYYDCVLPVSGGKDSYFAAHVCKEFNLNPLMVTYHGNNYLPEGEINLNNMKDVFGFDHFIFRPSTDTLIRLNLAGFKLHGDMNWHNHAGIFTMPHQLAVRFNIPLVFWGDHGFTEQGGMYSHNDFFEYTAKDRYENCLHGFDWFDFVGLEGLTKKELNFLIYPSDNEIINVGLRGIYLSNYFEYDGEHHATIASNSYNWATAEGDFDRTFRKISNLDDMHENGIHDYLKFIKLGYGRGTDHSNYAIRDGKMSREEGIKMVEKYDHVIPSDLKRWLSYVSMDEKEFHKIADSFRDPRVWKIKNNMWVKKTINGNEQSHGKVYK